MFLILICNITGFCSVAPHSSKFLITLGHLMPHYSSQISAKNVCNLFVIWVVTFHVSHPYGSTHLTLLLNIRISEGTAVVQWLRCCGTNRKVAGSIPDGVIGIFHRHNPSDRTMALGSTQPLTEMSTRRISWG